MCLKKKRQAPSDDTGVFFCSWPFSMYACARPLLWRSLAGSESLLPGPVLLTLLHAYTILPILRMLSALWHGISQLFLLLRRCARSPGLPDLPPAAVADLRR